MFESVLCVIYDVVSEEDRETETEREEKIKIKYTLRTYDNIIFNASVQIDRILSLLSSSGRVCSSASDASATVDIYM